MTPLVTPPLATIQPNFSEVLPIGLRGYLRGLLIAALGVLLAGASLAQETEATSRRLRPVRRSTIWIPAQGMTWQIQFSGALDIRRIDLLAPILRARFDDCARKGFDAVDPDNVDGYKNNTGFPLTAADQLAFNRFLAVEAHVRGLSIALKNDFDQAADLAADYDWSLAEQCFRVGECGKLEPFLRPGKAVFDIEYTEDGSTIEQFCAQAEALRISVILKHRELDAWRQSCR